MRIAQIATCSGPVREDLTGSVESLVWLLARDLTALGHEVTVYGCRGSQSPGRVIETVPGTYGEHGAPADWQVCEWMNLARAVRDAAAFDIIHSHVYLWGLPLGQLIGTPMVHTMHTCPYEDEALLRAAYPDAAVTAISEHQWRGVGDLPPTAVIHHGIDVSQFTFREAPDDYLCYLGRFIPGKGPLHAIEAAKRVGLPILLAGPPSPYFDTHIRHLVDDRQVRYVGPVGKAARDRLLGGARALLYPLVEPEPFGLVQVEAMACGTPVAATRIGAVPEIVQPGVSGSLVDSPESLAEAVQDCLTLDRRGIHAAAITRFSSRRMAADYAALYARIASDAAARTSPATGR